MACDASKEVLFKVENLSFSLLSLNRIGEGMDTGLFNGLPQKIRLKQQSGDLEDMVVSLHTSNHYGKKLQWLKMALATRMSTFLETTSTWN